MQIQNAGQLMTFNQQGASLLPGLLKLSHAEKLRVVNILLREIAAEEGISLETEQTAVEDRKAKFFNQADQYHLQLPKNYRFDREGE